MATRTQLLWADVPIEQRITEDFLRTRNGSSNPKWLEQNIRLLRQPQCGKAVAWLGGSNLYKPCGLSVIEGEFCTVHGGARLIRVPIVLPPLNREAVCPKCGDAEILTSYCNAGRSSYRASIHRVAHLDLRFPQEHFDRTCAFCSYVWIEG